MRIITTRTIAIVFITFLIGSCTSKETQVTGNPADAARSYIDAELNNRTDAAQFLCSTLRLNNIKSYLDQTKAMVGASVDTSSLTITVANQSGDTAQVKVIGTLKSKSTGKQLNFGTPAILMKYENGWKVCGF